MVCISAHMRREIFSTKIRSLPRKLLMHKKEIQKMVGKIAQKGYDCSSGSILQKEVL